MIKLPAYFCGFGSKVDGSASLRFNTQEIADTDFAELKRTLNLFGWLIFAENATDKDLPDEPPVEEGKTHSERLRSVLFLLWKQKKETTDFETWRKAQMEKFIEHIKKQLDD
jgi:hypothetical protein